MSKGTAILSKSDFKVVLKAVFPARERWWWIGLELGIENTELDGISGRDEECLKRMITIWLQKRSLNPTWQSLVKSLKEGTVGHEDVAADIEEKFMTEEEETPGPDDPKDPVTGEGYQETAQNVDSPPEHKQEEAEVEDTGDKELASCPKHSGELLNAYCEKCQALICKKCTTSHHKGHKFVVVADAFPKHLEAVENALQDFDSCTEEIENQTVEVKANLAKRFEQLHQALDQRKEELTKQLDDIKEQKLKSLAAQKDETVFLRTELSGCLEYTEESLERETLAKANPERLRPLETADILLVKDDAPTLAEACHNFATFITTTTDSIQCYTTGSGLKTATVGEEAEVSLHVKDKEGKGVDVKMEDIDVRLVSYKTGRCSVKSVGKGEYKLQYKPNTRGQHHLNIMIKGRQMREGTVVIRPQLQDLREPVMVIDDVKTPKGITTDSKGRIIVAEAGAYCVTIFTPEGERVQSFGGEGTGEGQFKYPYGVAVDKDDNIYVSDYQNDCLQKFTPKGEHLISVGERGSDPLEFINTYHMAFNPKDEKLYICDKNNDRVQILDTNLAFCGAISGRKRKKGKFNRPQGVACDDDGNVYIACGEQIQVFTTENEHLRAIGCGGTGPGQLREADGIVIDHDMVYVSDHMSSRVSIFTTAGKFLRTLGSDEAEFSHPRGITVDGNGYIIVADKGNDRIQIF